MFVFLTNSNLQTNNLSSHNEKDLHLIATGANPFVFLRGGLEWRTPGIFLLLFGKTFKNFKGFSFIFLKFVPLIALKKQY